MRGKTKTQPSRLALVSIESMVPATHPQCQLKPHVQRGLAALSAAVAFVDDDTLVTGSWDRTVRRWDLTGF